MSRNYVPGVIVQGRGLRGPKGDPGDMTDASTYFQATSLMSDYADLSHVHGIVLGHNVSVTSASDGMTLSVAALGAAANTLHAGDYISMDVVGPSSTISVTGLQSAGAYLTTAAGWDSVYLTTAALSTHIHGSVNLTTIAGTDVTYSSASSGLTLGIPKFLTTANETWHSHLGVHMEVSERPNYFYTSANTFANSTHIHGSINTASVTGSNITNSSVSSGLTLGIPNFLTTAANTTHTHGGSTISGYNISGTSASNGLTMSVGNAIALTNSTHFVNTSISSRFVQSWELEGAHTAGTTGSLQGSIIYFSGGDNITLSGSSNTIIISGNAGGGTGGVALGNTATVPFTSGSVMFQGTNVTINTSAGAGGDSTKQYINLVVADPVTGAIGALGNTASSNAFQTGSIMFSGSNITVNTSLGTGASSHSQWIQLVAADPAAATNAIVAGDYLSSSTNGAVTALSVTGLQPTTNMSDYIKTGGLSFVNSNGVYFGTTGAGSTTSVTAEFSSNLFFPEAYSSNLQHMSLTSLSLGVGYSTHTHGSNVSTVVTAGSDIKFSSSSNGLTAGIPAYLTTAAQSGHTHGSAPSITGGIGITSNSTAWSVSIPAFLTTAAQVSHTHGTPTLSLSNLSGSASSASNGLTVSLTGYPSTSFVNVSDTGNVYFVNPNATSGSNMTFGSSTSGNSTSIYITAGGGTAGSWATSTNTGSDIQISTGVSTNVLHYGNFLTTYTQSTHPHTQFAGIGTTGATGASATINSSQIQMNIPQGSLYYQDGNGVSFSASSSGLSTTISAYVNTTSGIGTSFSTVSTSGSVLLGSLGTAGISLAVPAWLTTAAGGAGGTSIVPGSYLSSSLDGSTLSLSVTGLAAAGHTHGGSTLASSATSNSTESRMRFSSASNGLTWIQPAFLTTAALSTHIHGNVSFGTRTGTAYTYSSASNGLTISSPNMLTTAAVSDHTHSNLYQSTGDYLTTAMASNAGSNYAGIATTGITGGSATINSSQVQISMAPAGTVYFSDISGFSFGSSTDATNTTLYLITA